MQRRIVLSLGGVLAALALVPAAVAASGTSVSVRVEGKTQTLMLAKTVQTHSGWITRFGAPKGDCPAQSAAGALDVATHHGWSGKWNSSFKEYFITKILGDVESGTKRFWEIFVNNVAASSGACEVKLRHGEQLLFASVPVSGTVYLLGVHAPGTATVGHAFKVKVVWFNAKGKSAALAGATIAGHKTNSSGIVQITPTKKGTLTLTAKKSGYVRSEAQVRVS